MSLMGSLFGRSPIRPMQQHMHAAVACARAVVPLIFARSMMRVKMSSGRPAPYDLIFLLGLLNLICSLLERNA